MSHDDAGRGFPGPDDGPDRRLVPGHAFDAFDWRFVEVAGADAAMEMDVTDRVRNSSGAMQGGIMATLIDMVAGSALFMVDGGYDRGATADMSVNFLEGVRTGPVEAAAHVLRRGRRTAVVRVDVRDLSRHTLVATATLTFAVRHAPTSGPPPAPA